MGKNPSVRNAMLGTVSPDARLVLNSLVMLNETGRDAIGQVARHMIEHSRLKVPDQHIDLKIGDRQTVGSEMPDSICLLWSGPPSLNPADTLPVGGFCLTRYS
jgi:hypothetical protein